MALQWHARVRVKAQGPQLCGNTFGDFLLVLAVAGDGNFRIALIESLPFGKKFFKALPRCLGNAA